MADFRLSERAASDLSGIADYTIQDFGIEQARRYRDGLVRSFRQLSDNPYWVVVLKSRIGSQALRAWIPRNIL